MVLNPINSTPEKPCYHVAFSCDSRYARHINPIIRGILKHDPTLKWEFHILSSGLSSRIRNHIQATNANVRFVKVSSEVFEDMTIPETCAHLTVQTFYRFLLPSLLPDISRVLYLDCDVSIVGSIAPLFDLDVSDYYAAVVQDGDENTQNIGLRNLGLPRSATYFNAGVMLINLDNWRRDEIQRKLFVSQKNMVQSCPYADQDVLNYTLHGQLFVLDKRYNLLATEHKKHFHKTDFADISILHHNGKSKPWKPSGKHPFKSIYLKTLNRRELGRYYISTLTNSIFEFSVAKNSVTIRLLKFTLLKIRPSNPNSSKSKIWLLGIKIR